MTKYVILLLVTLGGFGLWVLMFLAMRKGPDRNRDALGYVFIGPMHAYLKKRGYTLTSRELVGWGVVFLLMLVVPSVSWFLEK